MKKCAFFAIMSVFFLVFCQISSAAVDPMPGPFVMKTWNYEVGTSYAGGVDGLLYFRNENAGYFTEEKGFVSYDENNPTHRLFTGNPNPADDLTVASEPSLADGEDTFGLLLITQLWQGNITGEDSRFGDGSVATELGNDITPSAGGNYWNSGDNGDYLRGMFWGNQDQVVEVIRSNDEYRIWSSGGEFDIFEIANDAAYDPFVEETRSPDARVESDSYPGWFDRDNDRLVIGGTLDYVRFQGNATSPQNFDGESEVLINFDRGDWADQFEEWWIAPDGEPADMWQSWNIGDPTPLANGWSGSEDSGRAYVPEPLTLGLLGLGGIFLRKRR